MAKSERVNLTTAGWVTAWHAVPSGAVGLGVQIETATTTGWQSSSIVLQWKIDDGTVTDPSGQDFDPAISFASGTPARRKIDIAGVTHVRLKTATGGSGADPAATYVLNFI